MLSISLHQLFGVGEAGAIFLLIAPGAGPQGVGEAQVAKADDAYASFYNPAGLGFLKGQEAAGMHVNWLPNLASDLYYEFMTYRKYIDGLGSIGGHLIYLNLGEQIGMDEFGNPTDNWKSYMGSSKTLSEDIEKIGKKHFKFEIIAEFGNKRSLKYYECYYQIKYNVLTSTLEGTDEPAFYNNYIGGKFSRPIQEHVPI